jgi:hypothetical protein
MGTTPYQVRPLTQVNTTDGGLTQRDAQISATPDGGYVVVWTNYRLDSVPFEVRNQRYDGLGDKVGQENLLSNLSGVDPDPSITVLSNGVLEVSHRVSARTVYATGFLYQNDPFPHLAGHRAVIDHSEALRVTEVLDPAITSFADGSFLVASVVVRLDEFGGSDLDARFVDPNGLVGTYYTIYSGESRFPDLATLSNGNFVAVWRHAFNGSTTDYDIMYRVMTPGGGSITGPDTVFGAGSGGRETDPDVAALTGGGFVVVWTDPDSNATDIRATIYTNAGVLTPAANILVNTTTTGPQNEPNVVGLLDGGFLVTWDDDQFNFIRGQRFDAAGNPIGTEFNVAQGPYEAPEMARLLDGRIAFAMDDNSSADFDVATSIWNPRGTVASVGDVLWQQADGTVAIAAREIAMASANWEVQATGDFDADRDSDVLWRHRDGAVVIWEMQNGQLSAPHSIAFASVGWGIVSTGDFDDDGDSDVLWRHRDGAVVTWEMENGGYVVNHNIAFASTGWTMQGVGDFDADGDSDVIWRHRDGAVVTWEMENGAYVINHNIAFASTGWTIQGTGDFNGDGDDDILWRHQDGAVVIWDMQDGDYVSNRNIAFASNGWRIAGTPDFNGDGTDDILWRHQDGGVVTWEMRNNAFVQAHNFGVVGNDWQIRGTGEFDLL